MRGQVRHKMVQGASRVLARRGLHATAFSEVLAVTGASRGSIYHHFPGGKAELIEAVLEDYGGRTDDALQALHGQPLMSVVRGALASSGAWSSSNRPGPAAFRLAVDPASTGALEPSGADAPAPGVPSALAKPLKPY